MQIVAHQQHPNPAIRIFSQGFIDECKAWDYLARLVLMFVRQY